ncbi:hypothetical protein GOBAR_AA11168 [Gossypium barbadense]|uniref:Uncharacterized protein n=1 Tax=Gossypium barbadense TaxID=3634 RepID=A0A2P5Y1N6_GOSBA|nr:hypothetical protein GOBAR_AA11168 [Gossypium barbadense]
MENETQSLLPKNRSSNPSYSTPEGLELRSFRLGLNWFCLDQSNLWKVSLSWSFFFVLAIGVPIISHYVLLCSNCDEKHRRPYDAVVQLSLSSFAAVSFISLSSWARKYGIRKFLFLDKLCDVSDKVRKGYAEELQKSMKLLCVFVLPCLAAESAYRIWWYATGASQIPYLGNMYLASWLYRTSIFILACIFYQLTCHLQILRLEDFAQVFQKETEVRSILAEHLRIRRNLRIISHRFRLFLLLSLVLVSASQFFALLMTTRTTTAVNIYEVGELAMYPADVDWESDEEDEGDDLDNTKLVPIFAHTVSFQKRQALVTYLEHNRAGITVYGFMVDRTGIHTIFGIELALLLWLLNKTIVCTALIYRFCICYNDF